MQLLLYVANFQLFLANSAVFTHLIPRVYVSIVLSVIYERWDDNLGDKS